LDKWRKKEREREREEEKRGQPVDIVVNINNKNKNSTKILCSFSRFDNQYNYNIFNLASILGLRLKPDNIRRAVRTKKFKFKKFKYV